MEKETQFIFLLMAVSTTPQMQRANYMYLKAGAAGWCTSCSRILTSKVLAGVVDIPHCTC